MVQIITKYDIMKNKQIRIYLEVLDNEIKEHFNCC